VTRAEIRPQPIDMSEMAESIAAELRERNPDRRAEFIVPPGIMANGDPQLLRIVMENLLGNAWKFTGTRDVARIEFNVTHRDGETVYYVRDNGVGFDMAYVNKLFIAFQRLHTETEFPGTGIGLAIIQRIIRRHGGRIWAEGEVDKGATFYFTL
jgi:light-regulated signal transduction histidine kinase (bacteriophytochrome)